ncbi:MAG: UDP-N-acetylmuramate dehydrogenase [Clostridiales bacterium]|nr:UDP-N-acetylmuramate dehydrogenase [Clostridiales bacterium]
MQNLKDDRKPFAETNGLYEKIKDIVHPERVLLNEPMSNHTSFKIGGPAAMLIEIADSSELIRLLPLLKDTNVQYFIMGNGSNLLVSDNGYKGIVIKLADYLTNVTIDKHEITAEAGILLSTLSKIIAKESLIGFEFASGIPGTVGGAIAMNAGAYDGEMKNCVKSVKVLTQNGEILDLTNEEMNFGYRTSDIKKYDYIVLETTFAFEKGDPKEISEKTKDFTERRTSKQPLTLPSAGSMFKRPVGYFAGKLIDDSGLRGVRIGDAQISEKHCGFVVNRGNATCREVQDLIRMVQKIVKDNYGVMLETEVKYLGG